MFNATSHASSNPRRLLSSTSCAKSGHLFFANMTFPRSHEQISLLEPNLAGSRFISKNAIISAILHGHFQTEADGVKRSLEDLPAHLQKVGMEEKTKTVHLFAGLTEKEAKTLGGALHKAARDAAWVEPRNGEKLSMPHSIELKRFLVEIRAANGESRVK